MAQLPEYIVGIPTAKRLKAQRVALINQYYAKLLKELQAEHRNVKGNNYVVNDFLNAQIFITGDSLKKARNAAANTWQSTYAVKHLKEIIKKAKPLDGKGLQVDVTHGNTQTKNGYIKTIIVYHNFTNLTVDYLNFWVKLTIGVTTSGKHIQYAVNKIELT